MALRIMAIMAIHLSCFLCTLILGTEQTKEWLQETYDLFGNREYSNVFSPTGVTMSFEEYLSYLNTQFIICACLALLFTLGYYLYYKQKEGGLGSRRPVWFILLAVNILLSLVYTIIMIDSPNGVDSTGFVYGITTPLNLLVMVVPFYLATFFFCSYDAPLSYFVKNAFSGNRN